MTPHPAFWAGSTHFFRVVDHFFQVIEMIQLFGSYKEILKKSGPPG
jgi:hypothetical protein